MKRIAVVLGVAAVATFTGCKDPDYVGRGAAVHQDGPKSIVTEPTTPPPPPPKKCQCLPGTKHPEPCNCGAPDCKCAVEPPKAVVKPVADKPVVDKPADTKPVEPEYTTYIVQRGDYLAKISKKYNITIASIKNLNGLKDDKIRIGQKLKLPGKVDVGAQTAPTAAKPASAKKPYVPYTGATKEYMVKAGDTLGGIAYGNGINIPQLKELNGLDKDTVQVGQKLKIPAEKVVAQAKPAEPKKVDKAASKKVEDKQPDEKVVEAAKPADPVPPVSGASAQVKQPDQPSAPTTTYLVHEGEDITRLAVDYGITPSMIRELNNLGENDNIHPGQVLRLPVEAQ